MKRNYICIIGAILALITGIARGIGGATLFAGASLELTLGIGLLIVSIWLIISSISLIVKENINRKKWLTAGILIFWIDGILNGFLLFGTPQLSGQIINLLIVVLILCCIWTKKATH